MRHKYMGRWNEMQEPFHAILRLAKHPGLKVNLPTKLQFFMVVGATHKLELADTVDKDELAKPPLRLQRAVLMASGAIGLHSEVVRSGFGTPPKQAKALREAQVAFRALLEWDRDWYLAY